MSGAATPGARGAGSARPEQASAGAPASDRAAAGSAETAGAAEKPSASTAEAVDAEVIVDEVTVEDGDTPVEDAPAATPEAEGEDSAKVGELMADLKRMTAEYANYRRRAERERAAAADGAKVAVVRQFLPVLDDLDRARRHGDLETGPMRALSDKLNAVFEGLGLVAFGAEGDPFDPELHEAVQHEGDGSNPVLGMVMRHGYRLGDRLVRTAMVGVVDAPAESAAKNA
nr:nucleotide exchange factor GrpE [Millisia brevis]